MFVFWGGVLCISLVVPLTVWVIVYNHIHSNVENYELQEVSQSSLLNCQTRTGINDRAMKQHPIPRGMLRDEWGFNYKYFRIVVCEA